MAVVAIVTSGNDQTGELCGSHCVLSGVLCRPHELHACMRGRHTTVIESTAFVQVQHAVCPQNSPYQPVRISQSVRSVLSKNSLYI